MANNGEEQPVIVVSTDHMLQLGIELAGFKIREAIKLSHHQKFKSLYGCLAKSASVCFSDLQTKDLGDSKISKVDPIYFLAALYWMKGYGTEERAASACKISSCKTFRDHTLEYLKALQALK
jgi:hypothetical protein